MTGCISDFYVTTTNYLRHLTYKEEKVSLAQKSENFRLLIKGVLCDERICIGEINHIVAHSHCDSSTKNPIASFWLQF